MRRIILSTDHDHHRGLPFGGPCQPLNEALGVGAPSQSSGRSAQNKGCGDVDLTLEGAVPAYLHPLSSGSLEGAVPVRHAFIHFPVDPWRAQCQCDMPSSTFQWILGERSASATCLHPLSSGSLEGAVPVRHALIHFPVDPWRAQCQCDMPSSTFQWILGGRSASATCLHPLPSG